MDHARIAVKAAGFGTSADAVVTADEFEAAMLELVIVAVESIWRIAFYAAHVAVGSTELADSRTERGVGPR